MFCVFLECVSEQDTRSGFPENSRSVECSVSRGGTYEAENANQEGKKDHHLLPGVNQCAKRIVVIDAQVCFDWQVYEIKQSSSVVKKITSMVSKVLEPLHPHVEEPSNRIVKHLSHTFSREKQHL